VARDAEREVEPAALAARQRGDPRAGLLAEPDELDDLGGGTRGRVGGAVQLDRLADGERLLDAVLLQDDADPRTERALAPRRIVAQDRDLAGVGAAVALEDLDERRLARAVRTEHGDHLAA